MRELLPFSSMLANMHSSREETCCGETNMPNSALPSESKCSQRLQAQQKQQMREVIQHQVWSVAQATYSGTDMYTEYTYVYVYWGTIYFVACCKSTVLYSALGLLQNSFVTI